MAEKQNELADINDPMNFLNRELSILKFHRRVLAEAKDLSIPLLERVKFVGIVGSIMDEFFMVRVGTLLQQQGDVDSDFYYENMTPRQQLIAVRKEAQSIIKETQNYFLDVLMPELKANDIHILNYKELSKSQRQRVDDYFHDAVFPILTPLAFDIGHPFPHISNLSYNLAVIIEDEKNRRHFARVKIPDSLPYFLPLKKASTGRYTKESQKLEFVWIDQVIMANVHLLFPGLTVTEVHPFHVVRNAEIELQSVDVTDLLESMEESVRRRRFGAVVRLLVKKDISDEVLNTLEENLKVDPIYVYDYDTPLILRNIMQLTQINRPDLKYKTFNPATPKALQITDDTTADSFFEAIRRRNILVHHPYDSFDPVIGYLKTASHDPSVLAIKQTLYRVGKNSPVVKTLLEAQRDYDKQVAVLVELKARFDEESNIEWAKMLEQEGVHVTYGLLSLKTHSKVALVIRREGDEIRRYLHLATGNYNHITAGLYEDLGMFTCDKEMGEDATDLFNYLTGYSRKQEYRKFLVAPVNLRQRLSALILGEIENHKKHGNGHIIFKLNSISDREIMQLLYKASQAGVRIDLIVRGICCLKPQVTGLSEHICVISVLGRFLEHSRIFYFHNNGDEKIYMGSADLMPRNLDTRVEVLFPVEDHRMIRHIHDKILSVYLQPNIKAWEMQPDGKYIERKPQSDAPLIDPQIIFMERSKR